MGSATPEEREEFEQLSITYPELEEARLEFEQLLEIRALAGAQPPPDSVKEKVFEAIRKEKKASGLIVELERPTSPVRKISGMRWAVAACVILLAGCLGLIWFFYKKNQEIRQEMAGVEKSIDTLDKKQQSIIEQLDGKTQGIKHVQFENADKNVPATINVFWDSTSTDVYLVINNLAPLPVGRQYQIWAFTKGKPKSLGLFDAPKNEKWILKMTDVQQADSFSITVENTGTPKQAGADTIPGNQ